MIKYRNYRPVRNIIINLLLKLIMFIVLPLERKNGRTYGVMIVPWGEPIASERMYRAALGSAQDEREKIEYTEDLKRYDLHGNKIND